MPLKKNGFKQVVQIPLKAIARVIGKAGKPLMILLMVQVLNIPFNRDSEETKGHSEVELTGSKSALKEAVTKFKKLLMKLKTLFH